MKHHRFFHRLDSVLMWAALCLGSIVCGYIVADLIYQILQMNQ